MIYKILSWLLTPLFLCAFGGILVFFELVQRIVYPLFSFKFYRNVVHFAQLLLIYALKIEGTRITIKRLKQELPTNRPLILVSNHQSMYDIPFISWVFRKHFPKFISKKELGRGIPTVSYHLHKGGSVLIDRADSDIALKSIKSLALDIEKTNHAACIFPEGKRSRNGIMKDFKRSGLIELLTNAPNALVVPIAIDGSWAILRHNFLPVPFGSKLKFTVLEPIEPKNQSIEETITMLENYIRKALGQENPSLLAPSMAVTGN